MYKVQNIVKKNFKILQTRQGTIVSPPPLKFSGK